MNKKYIAPSVDVIEFDSEIKTAGGIELPDFEFPTDETSEPTEQIL